MDVLIFVVSSLIMSAIFGYLSVKTNEEDSLSLLQILFFIGCLFFGILSFAIQTNLAKYYRAAFVTLSNIPYQASILIMIAALSFIFLLILSGYFGLFNKVIWNRKTHKYEERGVM